jgi:hypothetical protein
MRFKSMSISPEVLGRRAVGDDDAQLGGGGDVDLVRSGKRRDHQPELLRMFQHRPADRLQVGDHDGVGVPAPLDQLRLGVRPPGRLVHGPTQHDLVAALSERIEFLG